MPVYEVDTLRMIPGEALGDGQVFLLRIAVR